MKTLRKTRLAVCIDNTGYPVALESWKLYRVLPDSEAKAHGQLRVIDESGEDYLFPASLFVTGLRFPWKKVPRRHVALFSRAAVARTVGKTVSAKTHNRAHTRAR
jgi:hypothetical protein